MLKFQSLSRLLAAISMIVTLGGGLIFSNSAQAQEDLLTYDNPQYGLSIRFPSDWSYEEYAASPNSTAHVIASFFPPVAQDPDLTTDITLTVENLPSSFFSLDEYSRDTISYYRSNYQNFSLESLNTGTLSGSPAYEMLFTYDLDGMDLASYEKGTIDNVDNRAYYLTLTSPSSIFDQFLPVAESMVNSFELGSFRDADGLAQREGERDDGDDMQSLFPENGFSGLDMPSEDFDMQDLELFMGAFSNSIFNGSSVFAAVGTSLVNGIEISGISLDEDGSMDNVDNVSSPLERQQQAKPEHETLTVTMSGTPPAGIEMLDNSSVTVIASMIPVDINNLLTMAALGSASSASSPFMGENGFRMDDDGSTMGLPISQENITDSLNPFGFLSTLRIGSSSIVNPDWSTPQSVSMSLVDGNVTNNNMQKVANASPSLNIVLATVIPYTGADDQR
jgi:hypothetical protein